jgi:cytochrome b561
VLRDTQSNAFQTADIDDRRPEYVGMPSTGPSSATAAAEEIATATGDVRLRRQKMSDMGTAPRAPFDIVTIGFHWATVLIVLALFSSAWLHAYSHDHVHKAMLLQVHRSLGVTIWATTLFRLLWRVTHATLPPFHAGMSRLQRALVKMNECALYALLLLQPVTGFSATLLKGRQFALFFWQVPPLMSGNSAIAIPLEYIHEVGACTFGVLILGHAAAALFHHFVLRDDVLSCMAPVIAPTKEDLLPLRAIGG